MVDTSIMVEKISNNTNNIGVGQLYKVGEGNKSVLGVINKSGICKTNIKARVRFSRANKSGISEGNIEENKKTHAKTVTSAENSLNNGVKITD